MGSGGEEAQNMGIAVMERWAARAAPLLGAPQPSIGLENKWDQRGTHGHTLEDNGYAHPAKPIAAYPAVALQPYEVRLLTMAQTYAAATRLSLTNNEEWHTKLSKHQKCHAKKPATAFIPAKNLPLEARCLIFSWHARASALPKPDQILMAAINNCLDMKGTPYFHQIVHVVCNTKGIITATSTPRVDAKTLITYYSNKIVNAIREVDWAVLDVQELEKYIRLKVHSILLNHFIGKGIHGVHKLQYEIQANHHNIQVLLGICRVGNLHIIKEWYWLETFKACLQSLLSRDPGWPRPWLRRE
jgi:hypothetical protein